MPRKNETVFEGITIIGSLPPLRALSSYCLAFSRAISKLVKVEFISFKYIYPPFLYPGGNLQEDNTFTPVKSSNLEERRNLSWYNPLSWVSEGLSARGQLLHAQWWSPPLILIYLTVCLIYKIRKKPVVITVHNVVSHDKHFFYNLCSRLLYKLADHFIVHSESNKELMLKLYGIDESRVTQIPHGPLEFKSANANREDARNSLGLSPRNKVVLIFGAIRPYKGVDIALMSFASVVKKIPEAYLVIAGKLWESWDRYEKIIEENKITDYVKKHLHYIDAGEVARYFMASDLVILPYLEFDSQSGVGATAVAFRKPMIVTKTGGLPELVVDQENVVPPGDSEMLGNRIIYCLKNPAVMERMSEESGVIADAISWNRIALDTVAIYKELLNKGISA